MVGFKNKYMVMEFLDPNRELVLDDPITQFNVSKAVKDSLLENFGECGLSFITWIIPIKYVNHITKLCIIRASREEYQRVWSAITLVRSIGNCPVLFNLLDLSGSIKVCKNAALKCDESKYKSLWQDSGASLSAEVCQHMQNCLEKVKSLEH